jgi:hypothetical protein
MRSLLTVGGRLGPPIEPEDDWESGIVEVEGVLFGEDDLPGEMMEDGIPGIEVEICPPDMEFPRWITGRVFIGPKALHLAQWYMDTMEAAGIPARIDGGN